MTGDRREPSGELEGGADPLWREEGPRRPLSTNGPRGMEVWASLPGNATGQRNAQKHPCHGVEVHGSDGIAFGWMAFLCAELD